MRRTGAGIKIVLIRRFNWLLSRPSVAGQREMEMTDLRSATGQLITGRLYGFVVASRWQS